MHLKELLKQIRVEGWKKIAIIGSERSGSTICAYILAQAFCFNFVREDYFGRMDYSKFMKTVRPLKNFVCQCPSLTSYARVMPKDFLVLAVNRDLGDILASQRRIDFTYTESERRMYSDHKLFDMEKPLAYIKYQFIEQLVARDRQVEYIDFESIEDHKLYVNQTVRNTFSPSEIIHKTKTPLIFDFGKAKK